MSSYRTNTIATATLVIEALESGKPSTDSAVKAFPRLATELRRLGRADLADRLDAARAKLAAELDAARRA